MFQEKQGKACYFVSHLKIAGEDKRIGVRFCRVPELFQLEVVGSVLVVVCLALC